MNVIKFSKHFFALFALILTLGIFSPAFGAATIVIANTVDAAGVGFNDTTVVAPVGGNPGTTLGQQRLNAFQEAANIWGATLTGTPTITIKAQWTALTCTTTSAVLGSAGSIQVFRDFQNAPFAGGTFANSGSRPTPDGADAAAVTTNSRAATAVTDASGTAVAPTFTANGSAGNYTVNATVPGAGTTTTPLGNLAPTAAAVSLSGRIAAPDGRGLRNAFVTVTGQNGESRTTTTGSFGYYAFANLTAGDTIAVRVESKRYRFQPQVLTLSDHLSGLNFIALP